MQKKLITLDEIKLVGIQVRTNNHNEMDPATAKISPTVQQYFQQQVFTKIQNRINPDKTYCAYTDYENDYRGDYTFFIGEEVNSFDETLPNLKKLSIPPQKYIKFTTEPGTMPMVVINAWQEIWQMSSSDLEGDRRYHTDFEIYDERSRDPNNTIVDICIGIKE